MAAKRTLITLIIIVLIAAAAAVGFVTGKKQGRTEGEGLYRALVDRAYPPPAEDMRSLSGTVKGVTGTTIDLEVIDPDDYLPHLDGTSQRKEIRFARVTSNTEIFVKDKSRRDSDGNPVMTEVTLSEVRTGDAIIVKSDRNIRDAEKFDATSVELIRYRP